MAAWRYSINYGPEGEANYAMVYDDTGMLVGNLRTHHAIAFVSAMNASPQPAASDVPHDVVRALNCRDDAEPCRRCGCETQHMVRVVPLVAGGDRGEAVSCGDADCCFRGPVAADMHAAVSAWNVVAGFLATPAPSTSTEEVVKLDDADDPVKAAYVAGWQTHKAVAEEALRAENALEPSLDSWAYAYANYRQGQRSEPRCEAPGAADIRICRDLIEGMLACRDTAHEIDRRKAARTALSESR